MKVLRLGSTGNEVKRLQKALGLIADGIFGRLTHEAVRAYQRSHGLFPNGIVCEKTWAALFPGRGYVLKRSRRLIKDIVVHCTATPEGVDKDVEYIRKIHLANGWSDIGYHYVIYLDGTIHNGRDVDFIGAHVSGYNAHSIGVVYVGGVDAAGKPKDTRTAEQKTALVKLLKELRELYPHARIRGHRDFSKDLDGNGIIEPKEWVKACPCFDAKHEYEEI